MVLTVHIVQQQDTSVKLKSVEIMETSDSEDCYESADDDFVEPTERKPQAQVKVSSEKHRPPDVTTNNNSPPLDSFTKKSAVVENSPPLDSVEEVDKNVNLVLEDVQSNIAENKGVNKNDVPKKSSFVDVDKNVNAVSKSSSVKNSLPPDTERKVDVNVNPISKTEKNSLPLEVVKKVDVNVNPISKTEKNSQTSNKEVGKNVSTEVQSSFVEEISKLRLLNEPKGEPILHDNNNQVQMVTLHDSKPKDQPGKVSLKDDEDIWAADEGWGWNDDDVSPDLEQTSKLEEKADKKEEDLWGAEQNCVSPDIEQTSTSKLKEKVEEKEDDLWGDEENWSVGESPQKKVDAAWSGWGNWGITSVLSTVSQGITNVLETGIGAPDPVELARRHKLERDETNPATDDTQLLTFGLGDIVKLVETTGNKVIAGGLDTLEVIGKKTMEVLQENDPGLKKKRAFLKIEPEKPVLSHILREAKERAEAENDERERRHFKKKANYETIFDDRQGLVHLEALEMLSRQCDIKLQTLTNKCGDAELVDLQETMGQVRELCELPPDDDDDETDQVDDIRAKIEAAVTDINIPITYTKLLDLWNETHKWIEATNETNEMEVHRRAIETLAELTAVSVEQFHKAGELLLIKEHRSTADEADSLVQLTTSLSTIISTTSTAFGNKLSSLIDLKGNKEEINELITNIYLEAANSSTYIRDAFQLLIPVLQVGAV